MSVLGWAVVWAHAADSAASGLRPVVARPDTPMRYAMWRALEVGDGTGGGGTGALSCDPIWPEHALICLRQWQHGKRSWVSDNDLAGLGLSRASAREALASQAPAYVATAKLVPVVGMGVTYLQLVDGDGWAATGLLRPDLLAERLGGLPIRVAVPAESVLVAWRVGEKDLDQVMAVGVRELYDKQPLAVSPHVHTWDGAQWLPFGEAVAK